MDEFTKKNQNDLSSLKFISSLDDRGRIVIPASIRNKFNLKFNSQVLLEFKKKIDGRNGVAVNIGVCGTSEAGSNPACGPNKRGEKNGG